MRGNPETGFYI